MGSCSCRCRSRCIDLAGPGRSTRRTVARHHQTGHNRHGELHHSPRLFGITDHRRRHQTSGRSCRCQSNCPQRLDRDDTKLDCDIPRWLAPRKDAGQVRDHLYVAQERGQAAVSDRTDVHGRQDKLDRTRARRWRRTRLSDPDRSGGVVSVENNEDDETPQLRFDEQPLGLCAHRRVAGDSRRAARLTHFVRVESVGAVPETQP